MEVDGSNASGDRCCAPSRWSFSILALVIAVLTMGASDSSASVTESMVRGLAQAEDQDLAGALPRVRAASRAAPRSLALLWLCTELTVEREGVARARAFLDSLSSIVPEGQLDFGRAVVARSTGREAVAAHYLGRAALDPTDPVDRWVLLYERLRLGRAAPESLEAWSDELGAVRARVPSPVLRQFLALRTKLLGVRRGAELSPTWRRDWKLDRPRLAWTEVRALLLAARLKQRQASAAEAERLYRECISLADSVGARRSAGLSRSYLALLLEAQHRYAEAVAVRAPAVEHFAATEDSIAWAYAAMGQGWDLDQVGAHDEAVELSAQARDLWRNSGNRWGEAQTENNLGVAFFHVGDWERASRSYRRGLDLAEARGDAGQRRMLLNNVAVLEDRRGRPDRAVEIYRDLLDLDREQGDGEGELDVLNNLGLACLQLGESEQAREFFRTAVELSESRGRLRLSPTINLAMVLADEAQLDLAAQLLGRARSAARRQGNLDVLSNALAWSGRVAQRQGNLPQARGWLASADSLQRVRGGRGPRVPTLIRLADLQFRLGEVEQALRTTVVAESLAQDLTRLAPAASVACARADLLSRSGRHEEAREWARESVRRWSLARGESGAQVVDRSAEDRALCTAMRVLYESSAASRDPGAQLEELLRLAMDFHTRVERVGVDRREPERASAEVDSLLTVESQLHRRVEELQIQAQAESPAALRLELAEAETALQALRRAVAEVSPDRARHLAPLIPSLERLREAAAGDFTLISYVLGPPRIGPEGVGLLRILIDRDGRLHLDRIAEEDRLRRQIGLWKELLRRPPRSDGEAEAERRLASKVGRALLPPWWTEDEERGTLVIAADGALSDLAFTALRMEGWKGAPRLIEVAAVQRVTSLAAWFAARERPRSERAFDFDLVVCAVDDSLAGTESRASIATVFRRSRRLPPSSFASSDSRPRRWPRSRVLHFDSHGFFDERRAWRSGLYASGREWNASTAKPFLQQADLSRLRIDHDLVTLAACETARREDAVLHSSRESFAQTLLDAGSRAVLATAWSVDDELASWTSARIYRRLAEGESVGAALRQTQLELMRRPATAEPFYWAAWSVMGDGAQRIPLEMRRAPRTAWLWFGLSTILLAIAALLRHRASTTSAG